MIFHWNRMFKVTKKNCYHFLCVFRHQLTYIGNFLVYTMYVHCTMYILNDSVKWFFFCLMLRTFKLRSWFSPVAFIVFTWFLIRNLEEIKIKSQMLTDMSSIWFTVGESHKTLKLFNKTKIFNFVSKDLNIIEKV